MSNSEVGRVVLTSSMPATLLRLFDNNIELVAEEWGIIDVEVDPGVYRVEAVFSDVSQSQLIMVKPGQTVDPQISLRFATCGPVEQATSTSKTHSNFAIRISEGISRADGPSAGLGLILRNLNDGPKLRVDTVELLDNQMKHAGGWPSDWILADVDIVGKWATLEPGPYVLRTSRIRNGAKDVRHQTIWLARGWQTLIFLENQSTGADAWSMSIQMARLDDVWQPNAEESLILEATLAGLRAGITYMPPNTISRLLDGTFQNPMLGIAAAHAYLLGPPMSNEDVLARVVRDLLHRVGGHPDVIALASVSGMEGFDVSVTWPPMFYRSYRDLLLPADFHGEDVIPEDSPAERVAPFLRGPGPWLQWTDTEEMLSTTARVIPMTMWTSLRWAEWYGGDRDRVPERAFHLVEKGLHEMASFQKVERTELVESLGVAEIARILELPKSLVRSTLMDLGLPTGELVYV